ncbi:MAG: SDR family oxidoreductase [Burkholderiaceae bacterium]|nr:MAG: SDR family oxidoreductase [Burkholderiaceae bacterium]
MSALPRLFRRQRLLIVGCGDVGMRILRGLQQSPRPPRIFALTRQPETRDALRAAGAVSLLADLDQPRTLQRLRGLSRHIIHLAPPPPNGTDDPRTRHLLAQLRGDGLRLVYVSTSGVYGDCAGAWVDETRPLRPQSARAQRRIAAEQCLREWGARRRRCVSILRAPGIYAAERLPLERLRQGLPVLRADEDVYTNHIHADDLARLCGWGLVRGRANRVYNACDAQPLKMGDWMDAVARALDLPVPARQTAAEVKAAVSAVQWSFLCESRRLSNRRLLEEWGVRLRYPQAMEFLQTLKP